MITLQVIQTLSDFQLIRIWLDKVENAEIDIEDIEPEIST